MTSKPPFRRVVFVVRGDDGPARAESLDRVRAAWEAEPAAWVEDEAGSGLVLYVIVTEPRRSTSVDHALSYARGEIRDGIGEAGGSIWDRTHVQITARRPRGPRS
jgi:hypothetical protein